MSSWQKLPAHLFFFISHCFAQLRREISSHKIATFSQAIQLWCFKFYTGFWDYLLWKSTRHKTTILSNPEFILCLLKRKGNLFLHLIYGISMLLFWSLDLHTECGTFKGVWPRQLNSEDSWFSCSGLLSVTSTRRWPWIPGWSWNSTWLLLKRSFLVYL